MTRQSVLYRCLILALICLGPADLAAQKSPKAPQSTSETWSGKRLGAPLLRDPIFVYNNWSSYDELSDNVLLTEQLAMKELDELLRLRRQGVHFDYYTVDAFWFAPDGGYRTWRKTSWPNGPDRWIQKCRENGILPGLWFGTNALVKIDPAPEWQDSLNPGRTNMSFSEGGFLPHFMDTLQLWYDRGIRLFKFDFVDFGAATAETEKKLTKEEIRSRNVQALREALRKFRQKNPDVVLVAFNGFGGDMESTAGPFPFRNQVDTRWLEVFDSMYSGDPRPSDVPQLNFWRSMDIYSDHMVRRYEQSYLPLERIDSTAFMIGNTGTNYYRKMNAWKGMLVLMLARGGWVNTVHGNLEFIDDANARWFAKTLRMFMRLQAMGRTKTFGGIPGDLQPYGFGSLDTEGAIYTVLNPAHSVEEIQMPLLSRQQKPNRGGRVLFRDAGFVPTLSGDGIKLGPGQMAVVGYGRYARPEFDLGIQEDVQIPVSMKPLEASFSPAGNNIITASVDVPARGNLRIVMRQRGQDGGILRSWPGGPPNGTNVAKVLSLRATQEGRPVPIEINYDKVIWSGLSWAEGEIKRDALRPGVPVQLECSSAEKDTVVLEGKLFEVEYQGEPTRKQPTKAGRAGSGHPAAGAEPPRR